MGFNNMSNVSDSVVDPDSLNPEPDPAFQLLSESKSRVLMTKT
jgi:hypothetical protein